MTTQVALLRGINVGGHRRLPMAELRAAMAAAGFANVRTYIASGNLLFDAVGHAPAAEARLAALIAERFGFACEVIVRDAALLGGIAATNPWPEAARDRPKALHMLLTKRPVVAGAADSIAQRARGGEQVAQTADALWIDFGAGLADSKLTPAIIDKAAGSPATARNWLTLTTLMAMAAG